jgi:hypothetical protein
MIMENNKSKTTVNSLWQELSGMSQPLSKLQSKGSIFEGSFPFGSSIKQISFSRHHPMVYPMEHSAGRNEPDMTVEDWFP